MWNPSATDLIALKAALNILNAKVDQTMPRLVKTAPDACACSSEIAGALPAPNAQARVAPAPAVEATDDAALAQCCRPIPSPEIGGSHHRASPPDILAKVDCKSSETDDRFAYVMGRPGLRDLSHEVGIPVWKIGTCVGLRLRQ